MIITNKLPKEHHFSHQYCMEIHDIWVEILSLENDNIFNTEFDLWDDFKESKLELEEYLISKWWWNELDTALLKQLFWALLSEFTQFIYTAFRNSEQWKLSVTYCLLRKPLKDILYILEYMVARPIELINIFKSDEIHTKLNVLKAHWHNIDADTNLTKKITREAILIVDALCNANMLNELRFSKDVKYWFEVWWQKANHLITSKHINMKTQNWWLNFAFSNRDDKLSQRRHIYWILPYIMSYYGMLILEISKEHFNTDEFDFNYASIMYHFPITLWLIISSTDKDKLGEINIPYESMKLTCMSDECKCSCKVDHSVIKTIYSSSSIVLGCWKLVNYFDIESYKFLDE